MEYRSKLKNFQKRKLKWLRNKEMVNILGHQGNENLNCFEISSYTIRMANINKTNDNSSWRGCGARGTLVHCWWESKLVQPLWKSVWPFLRKIGIVYIKTQLYHTWAYTQRIVHPTRGTCSTMPISLLVTARKWEQPRCPSTEEWIKKMWYIYTMEPF